MNKNNRILSFVFLSTFCLIMGQEDQKETIETNVNDLLIPFNLQDEKLIDIINRIAGYKQINLLLPSVQQKLNETSVTFSVSHKIKLSTAWEIIITMLDIAGFTLNKLSESLYQIDPIANINKLATPLYINVAPEALPNSNTIIRYLYYFQNIYLKEPGVKESLTNIIKDMLPMQNSENNFYQDDNYNSLLITAPSMVIQSIMSILQELDQNGFREAIEVIPIIHTNAQEIVNIISQLIAPKSSDDQFRFPPLVAENKAERKAYFSSSTRVVPIAQTNSIAIFGLYDSVQRVKDFIRKYLDKKVDADKSVLHYKTLKYLDAQSLQTTLTNLVTQGSQDAQSTGASLSKILKDVLFVAEQTISAKARTERKLGEGSEDIGVKLEDASTEQGAKLGGNSLIIACSQQNWKILNDLLDQIDQEQWQVALEVLIVDMTVESSNMLGTQLRRFTHDTNPHDFKWQLAQVQQPLLDYTKTDGTVNSTTGIEADLLSEQYPTSKGSNIASVATAGSTLFTFKDNNGMAAVLELLSNFTDTKIISKPFIIARNNEQANILSTERKMVTGTVNDKSVGGTAVVNNKYIDAATEVKILPRISKPAVNINLEIEISANEFDEQITTSDVIRKRTLKTNANVGHKEVLVLGGISRAQIDNSINETPLLGKIPILGYLFKQKGVRNDQRNLMIFISPTRIPPISTSGNVINKFTKKQLDYVSDQLNKGDRFIDCPTDCVKGQENFQCLKDPITTFFFRPQDEENIQNALQGYAKRGVWSESIVAEEEQQPQNKNKANTQPIISKKQKDDSLKKLLKNEHNPLKS